MLIVALYTTAATGALWLAVHALEARSSMHRRWLWLAVMLLSTILPVLASSSHPTTAFARADGPMLGALVGYARFARRLEMLLSPRAEQTLRWLWLLGSVSVAGVLLRGHVASLRLRARGHAASIEDTRVIICESLGPAVVGIWRPQIVLPAWIHTLSPESRDWVVRHERAHLEARDAQLQLLSWLLIVLMPWNPFLWSQQRRLRDAIELDCDDRIAGSHHQAARYASALLEVGRRFVPHQRLMLALAGPASLPRRVHRLLHTTRRPASRFRIALSIGVVGVMSGGIAWARPPLDARSEAGTGNRIELRQISPSGTMRAPSRRRTTPSRAGGNEPRPIIIRRQPVPARP